jgi:protein gp37
LSGRFGDNVWGKDAPRKTFGVKHWNEPLKWNRDAEKAGVRARVFCSSMCDIWEDHPTITAEREKLWTLIRATPWLTWQLLTKRIDRVGVNRPADWNSLPNVWLGTSIENADYFWRAEALASLSARVRFISYEPALGDPEFLPLGGIHWVIYGGESGSDYRQDRAQWGLVLQDKCRRGGVAFFMKQRAGLKPGTGLTIGAPQEFPEGAPRG